MVVMQKKLSVKYLQWITWILLFTVQTLSLLAYDSFSPGACVFPYQYRVIHCHHLWECIVPATGVLRKEQESAVCVPGHYSDPVSDFGKVFSQLLYLQPFLCR